MRQSSYAIHLSQSLSWQASSTLHQIAVQFCVILTLCLTCSPSASAQNRLEVPQAVLQAEQQRIETMERVASSVVAIFAPGGEGGGSGVLIDASGFTVTNFHVVQGLGGFMKCGLNDGKVYDAVLVGIDPTGDVAMIKLLGRNDFPHAQIGDSDTVRMGDWTFAMGNPFLLADDFQPTVTYGMVSGTHRYQYPAGTFLEYTDCIQVDTSINPGNSGGPLFNSAGELIGINGRISVEKRGRVNVGAGYAISINQVMHFLDHLKSGRIVDHATLGAIVTSTSDGAVVVSNILETSAAYRRGLRQGDELISFAGRPVRSVNQFKNILGIYPKGWRVPLSFQRDGQRYDVQVQLAGLHRRAELAGGAPPAMPVPEEKPEEKDEQQPPLPIPLPHFGPQQEPDVPEEYLSLYEEKVGYANYHFNAMAQERLLQIISDWGNFKTQPRMWALDMTKADGSAMQIRMQPDAIAARIQDEFAVLELNEEFSDAPTGSGGFLAALEQLKQLLVDPAEYFTEIYYVGSEPLDGDGERVDVLQTTKGLVATRWYFTQKNPSLIGYDTSIDPDRDACRIRFVNFMEFSGLKFPAEMTVQQGDTLWAELRVSKLNFLDPATKGAP